MDPSVWLPWAWGAGAVLCGVALWMLHPWRRQFGTAFLTWRKHHLLWVAPVPAVAVERVWQWTPVSGDASSLPERAGLLTGDSLAAALTWITHGDVLAMVLAAAFFADSAGLRRGLWKGIEAGFSPAWQRVLRVALLASATAALGMPAVRFGAGGETGRLIVKLMAALWTSTAATLLMCWLMLAFEAACRPPSKSAKIRMAEMTGQCTARLWLPVLAGAAVFPLMDLASPGLQSVLRLYAWPAAALLAWFPLTALRTAEAGEIHTVVSTAIRRWGSGMLPFTGWLAVAGTCFFAFHLLTGWLILLCPDGSWWRAATALLTAVAEAWLAVWMLGAWVAIQMDRLPSATKNARSSRREALA